MVPASEVFDLLAQCGEHRFAKYEVTCAPFHRLRAAMFRLVLGLTDDEAGDPDLAAQLRRALSEWLTVPIPFAGMQASGLAELGGSELVSLRWGADINKHADAAREALEQLRTMESPLRTALADAIVDAVIYEKDWRVYCHRAAAPHFLSLAEQVGCGASDVHFLHSLRDYRNARPFDLLIRVGPFRARGWGAAPGALVHSPRFRELQQYVWVGSANEAGFGDDPLLAAWSDAEPPATADEPGPLPARAAVVPVRWQSSRTQHGGSPPIHATPADPPEDELDVFSRLHREPSTRRAVLLHVDDGFGILYPLRAEVLLLDPAVPGAGAVSRHVLGDVDPTGRFLLWPELGEINLGAHVTGDGSFSVRWKAELRRRAGHHRAGLIRNLQAAGITLRNLDACVDHWVQPPSSVIHSPQQRRHFRILIDVLEMEAREEPPAGIKPTAGWWWRAAWREIAASRGVAIQVGMQEQEIIGEELDRILFSILPDVRGRALDGGTFRITIPTGHSLTGSISFLPVRATEEGFCAPESCLKILSSTSAAEEWRA